MPGPLILAPAGPLVVSASAATTGLIVGGAIASGIGLTWLLQPETSSAGYPMKYQQFMKKRLAELIDEGMASKDAMSQIGKEWREYKAQGATTSSPSISSSETKLKGTPHTLRLELPYQIEAQPDLSAAWDVAEGILDYLMENASGISAAQSFRQRAAAAYVRAKGGTSDSDQNEYELGRNLAEALLLVMAHRGFTQNEWVEMLPPQIVEESVLTSPEEDKGLIDRGLELLGLDDEESASSKVLKEAKNVAVEAGGQTLLDMLTTPQQ